MEETDLSLMERCFSKLSYRLKLQNFNSGKGHSLSCLSTLHKRAQNEGGDPQATDSPTNPGRKPSFNEIFCSFVLVLLELIC